MSAEARPVASRAATLPWRAVEFVLRRDGVESQPHEPLLELLRGYGLEAQAVRADEATIAPDRILWLQGTPCWYPRVLAALEATPRSRRPFVVVWHAEPLPFPRAAGLPKPRLHLRELAKIALRDERVADPYSNARILRRLARRGLVDVLAAASAAGAEYLSKQRIEAVYVPLGSSPSDGRDLRLERDIDVLFLGSMDVPRRRPILRALRASGAAVEAAGAWHDPRYWGEERTRLLNRTKILLNLPRHAGLLSGRRLILGLANRTLVVSEPIYRPEPYRPGVHYVSSSLAEMSETIRLYLEDDARREKIATAGHRFVHEELTLERAVARIVAAMVERAGDAR